MNARRVAATAMVCGAIAAAGCGGQPGPAPGPTPSPAPTLSADDFPVIAEARLLPQRHLQLSFSAGGTVAEVLAQEGQTLAAGEVIARLKNSEALQAEVARAELELLNAQQAVSELHAAASNGSARADAALAAVEAQAALDQAQHTLEALETPNLSYYADRVADAERALTVAEQNAVITDLAGPGAALAAAQDVLADADGAVQTLADLEARYPGGYTDQLAEARAAQARAADSVQVLTLQADQAQQNSALAVAEAQTALDRARAALAGAQAGAAPIDLVLAQAQVSVAEADLAEANDLVERLAAGPDPEALAQAEMRVSVAEAALAAAQAALELNALRAPFAGTLASLDLQAGQRVGGGQAVATLADFSGWVLETGNLTEVEVVRVRAGQEVALAFDALPELSLRGTVLAIRDVYTDVRGDVTYTVRIALAEGHPALRWGMTAQASFE